MNIEELVKKHIDRDGWSFAPDGEVASAIRNALTEQAEAFKGELAAYDGMVRELTKTVEDMRAAQAVPVVGEPTDAAYKWMIANGVEPMTSLHKLGERLAALLDEDQFSECEALLLTAITAINTFVPVPAAELATLREKAAMADEMSANIEALVKKHIAQYRLSPTGSAAKIIRAALTEQAESFKGELQAYDGMVRELTKTVEDMQAAQSVPVVGEPIAWVEKRDMETLKNGVLKGRQTLGMYLSAFYTNQYSQPLTQKPTASITAAELATLREKAAMVDELRKDAERYRFMRDVNNSLERIDYAKNTDNGRSCYHVVGEVRELKSGLMLDTAIDAAIAQGKGE